ncbi:hypothetical protein DERF_008811 [Dermatophagoides farinae]|uniref:Uncharacterized protein n=1 Tax=Dermatophagoides farinae TaxID=6954 RepID=A0A922I362_DERFA|nr:hypothetical protein DERF_008811 [Dermatophagoides farinae]
MHVCVSSLSTFSHNIIHYNHNDYTSHHRLYLWQEFFFTLAGTILPFETSQVFPYGR